MKVRLSLSCLLLASIVVIVQAQVFAPARPTSFLVRKHLPESRLLEVRQILGFGGSSSNGTDSTSNTSQDSTTSTTSSSSSSSSATTSSTSSSSSSSSSSTRTTSASQTATATPSTASSRPESTVVVTSTLPDASSTSTAAGTVATASSTAASSSSGSSHTGLIVGVSVVGGIAVLGALIFLWMKFGGKRFSDYQDEDADIKWPELKADGDSAAMQPLPARRTGGAGFDMGNEFDDTRDVDGQSMAEYGNNGRESMMGSSTALNAGMGAGGSYAATNGPSSGTYHDDANSNSNHYGNPAVAGYYDPYSGYNGTQQQAYYPEGAHGQQMQYDNYTDDYHNQNDPYGAARAHASSTSPQMQPYRSMGNQGMHQGY